MKKLLQLIAVVLLFSLTFYSCEQSQIEPDAVEFTEEGTMFKIDTPEKIRYCGEDEVCLWAGQHIDAGYVKIGNDDENLYITVHSNEGFQDVDENLKISIVTELPENRPPAGSFPYKTTVAQGVYTVTYSIPLSDLIEPWPEEKCSPHQFYVLVHADVIANGEGETAWGGCEVGASRSSWWFYAEYYTYCCACWCGFGNDYQNPEMESCKTGLFEGNSYKFWSNKHNFDKIRDKEYSLSLLVNPTTCQPQDTDGKLNDMLAFEVGKVVLKAYEIQGNRFMDVKFILDEKYKGYNIQLDVYNGADRVPKYDLDKMIIITDNKHMLYQTRLDPGETTFTFEKLPWLTHDSSSETYIALHAAIGDCPMPSLQNPVQR